MKRSHDGIHELRHREMQMRQKGLGIRAHKMHGPVSQFIAETDPNGYAKILAELREDSRPATPYEESLVERYADCQWRLYGAWAYETKMLEDTMSQAPNAKDTEAALAYAFIKGLSGPNLLTKLSVYQEKLQNEISRCISELSRLGALNRRRDTVEQFKLQELEPCTNVIQ